MNYPLLHGQGHYPLTQITVGQRLHPEVAVAFLKMQQSAHSDGIGLDIYSSFRSFTTQQVIWDQKWQGKRPILDDNNQPLDYDTLNNQQRLMAILRWSSLPGASRHHWGTDLDIFDTSSLPTGDKLRLISQEYAPGGHQHKLWCWLNQNACKFGFSFPYAKDIGGVGVEPWHISYVSLSQIFQHDLTLGSLAQCISRSQIEGRNKVLEQLEIIYHQFITIKE